LGSAVQTPQTSLAENPILFLIEPNSIRHKNELTVSIFTFFARQSQICGDVMAKRQTCLGMTFTADIFKEPLLEIEVKLRCHF
jgi:hypothetical protein